MHPLLVCLLAVLSIFSCATGDTFSHELSGTASSIPAQYKAAKVVEDGVATYAVECSRLDGKIAVSTSLDAGTTWNSTVIGQGGPGNPVLIAKRGQRIVVFHNCNGINIIESRNNGKTWGSGRNTNLSPDAQNMAIFISGTSIYVAWVSVDAVQFARSGDFGTSFEKPVTLMKGPYITFNDLWMVDASLFIRIRPRGESGQPVREITLGSKDDGRTWEDQTGQAMQYVPETASTLPADYKALQSIKDGTWLFVVEKIQKDGAISVRISPDAGSTWQSRVIGQGGMGNPVFIVKRGRRILVFHGTGGIDVIESLDGGNSWSPEWNTNLTKIPQNLQAFVSGNTIYLVWSDGDSVEFARSADFGTSFGRPMTLMGGATNVSFLDVARQENELSVRIILGSEAKSRKESILRSSDDGASWR